MAENNGSGENGYVDAFSRIKKIRYIIVTLLIIFVVIALFAYREDLTIENLRYLLKYVDVKPVAFGSGENTQINFESDSETVTASFKEDLVVLTKSALKIYDLTSTEILDSSHALTKPAVSLGEKYFAVYDVGYKYVGIYNSFSKLWEHTFDYPIYDVALDEKGNFCVATGAKDHTSALMVYNNSFENIFNWKSVDKYALCADIHYSDAVYMAVGALKSTESGDILSSLVLLSAESDKVLASLDFDSELVMEVVFNSEGNVAFLTDKALRFIAPSGELLSEYLFNSKSLRKFDAGAEWSVLILNENLVGKTHKMIIFDANGNTYMESAVESEITDLCVSESFAFVLGVEDITVTDLGKKTIKTYDSERSYRSVELLDEENVYLVYDGSAMAAGVSVE